MNFLIAMCFFAAVQTRLENARLAGHFEEQCDKCCGPVAVYAYGAKIETICKWCGRRREL